MSAPPDTRLSASSPVVFLIGTLSCVAWLNRFIQDDAFISFHYARNFVEGQGLTFNPGERVEGYTNFLWTVVMAIGFGLGLEPVAWSQVVGVALFAVSLGVTFTLAAQLSESRWVAIAAVLLLGTNFSFSAYATGGLETQMQACLVLSAFLLSWRATRGPGVSRVFLVLASCVYGLACLTRLDSSVALVLPGLLTLAVVVSRGRNHGTRALDVLALCLPAFLLLAPWFLWKLSYYGELLPNTFYAKVSSSASALRGIHYVYRFFASYWLLPMVAVAVVARPGRLWRLAEGDRRWWSLTLLMSVALWCAYVASVGGDFMEFRLMVPVLPLLMVLFAWGLFTIADEVAVRRAVVAVAVLGSVFHAATFWGAGGIQPVSNLSIHMTRDGGDWDDVGRALGRHFSPDSGVRLAVAAAGAVPFYSRLFSVDMRGLVDPWVARNGILVGTQPGHQRMAPLGYLVDRGVNLVVGHPQVVDGATGIPAAVAPEFLRRYGLADPSLGALPQDSSLLAIPMSEDRYVLVLYLVRHPAVDHAVLANDWATIQIG